MSEPWPRENEPPDGESWLDAELRRVAPPRGLLARLRAIPGGSIPIGSLGGGSLGSGSLGGGSLGGGGDEALDAMLRDVPLPAGLVGRLLRIGEEDDNRGKRRSRLEERAVAASLVVLSWCSYAAALVLFWIADYPFARAAAATWLQSAARLEANLKFAEPETMTLVDASVLDAPQFGPGKGLVDQLAESLHSNLATAAGDLGTAEALPDEQLLAFHSPYAFSAMLDSSGAMLDLPAAVREVAGAEVPAGPGFDRSFLSRTGVFPRVDPRRHPVSRAPLTTETASYDLARERLAEGRLPNPDEIRTEDFLAAVDLGLPRPEQPGLALFVAGCQAPWTISPPTGAGERSWLLQIAVRASDFGDVIPEAGKIPEAGNFDPAEIVAADVVLNVRFNADTVRSYRLYGHEPTRLEGADLNPPCELRCGQAASVVYELQFASPGDREGAEVTLQWRDPAGGDVRRLSRSIRQPEFVAEMIDASATLRLAALAVAAGEKLRQSPFAESIDLAELLDLARQGAKGPTLPGEFQKFVDLLEPLAAAQSGSDAPVPKPAGAQEPRSP